MRPLWKIITVWAPPERSLVMPRVVVTEEKRQLRHPRRHLDRHLRLMLNLHIPMNTPTSRGMISTKLELDQMYRMNALS